MAADDAVGALVPPNEGVHLPAASRLQVTPGVGQQEEKD